MTKSERRRIVTWSGDLTNEELEQEYYRAVFATLGSQAEEMYERGYDMVDIIEREKFEKWLGERADLIEKCCEERGIKLWEDYYERQNKSN